MLCGKKEDVLGPPQRLALVLVLGDDDETEHGCQHQRRACRVTLYGPPAAKRVEEPKRQTGFARDVEKEVVS